MSVEGEENEVLVHFTPDANYCKTVTHLPLNVAANTKVFLGKDNVVKVEIFKEEATSDLLNAEDNEGVIVLAEIFCFAGGQHWIKSRLPFKANVPLIRINGNKLDAFDVRELQFHDSITIFDNTNWLDEEKKIIGVLEYMSFLAYKAFQVFNPVVLPIILSHLPLADLKAARLVSSKWNEKALPLLSRRGAILLDFKKLCLFGDIKYKMNEIYKKSPSGTNVWLKCINCNASSHRELWRAVGRWISTKTFAKAKLTCDPKSLQNIINRRWFTNISELEIVLHLKLDGQQEANTWQSVGEKHFVKNLTWKTVIAGRAKAKNQRDNTNLLLRQMFQNIIIITGNSLNTLVQTGVIPKLDDSFAGLKNVSNISISANTLVELTTYLDSLASLASQLQTLELRMPYSMEKKDLTFTVSIFHKLKQLKIILPVSGMLCGIDFCSVNADFFAFPALETISVDPCKRVDVGFWVKNLMSSISRAGFPCLKQIKLPKLEQNGRVLETGVEECEELFSQMSIMYPNTETVFMNFYEACFKM